MAIGKMPRCPKHNNYYAHECRKCLEEETSKKIREMNKELEESPTLDTEKKDENIPT